MTSPSVQLQVTQFFDQYPRFIYQPQTVLIQAGYSPETIYFLEKGHVSLAGLSATGQEMIFNIFKPETFFPLSGILGHLPNTFQFQAIDTIHVRQAPVAAVEDFLKRHPEVVYDVASRLMSGLMGVVNQLQQTMSADAEQRLARVLYVLNQRFGTGTEGKRQIELSLSHAQLSTLAGLTRETVTRTLTKWRQEGKLDYQRRHLTILDMKSFWSLY